MSVAKLIIGDDSEGNIEKGGEKMTVKVVNAITKRVLFELPGEKLTDDLMELITEKGIETEDGDHLDFDPATMEIVEVRDVICNKTDDCGNQLCEHTENHMENEILGSCGEGKCIAYNSEAKCVPVSSAVNVPKVRSEIEHKAVISCEDAVLESEAKKLLADGLTKAKKYTEGITGPAIPPEVTDELEDILHQMWEGDVTDLNLKKIVKKEAMYRAVINWLVIGLDDTVTEEKDVEEGRVVYDRRQLDKMLDQVEKALKILEGL